MKMMRSKRFLVKWEKRVSSGGSNVGESGGSGSSLKRQRQKGHMDNFFTPNPEMVVQNRKNSNYY